MEAKPTYASTPSAYYATGQWTEFPRYERNPRDFNHLQLAHKGSSLKKAAREAKFTVISYIFYNQQVYKLGFTGRDVSSYNSFYATYFPKGHDYDALPSEITDAYWQQAPIPPTNGELVNRFTKITRNSGKFLIFTKSSEVDALWEKLLIAYQAGKLGYGMQASTPVKRPHISEKERIIVVYTEDAFDMDETARVAWEIDQVVTNQRGSHWIGALQYMTDRCTKAKMNGSGQKGEEKMLYTISSPSFYKFCDDRSEKVTLQEFTEQFKSRFTKAVQDRQDLLARKKKL